MASDALIATTTENFLKGRWENFTDYNPVFKIAKSKGRLFTGQDGQSVDWVVEVGRYAPVDIQDMEEHVASRKNHYMRCNLAWGEKLVADVISKSDEAKVGEKATLFNFHQRILPKMGEDLMDEGLAYAFLNTDGAEGAIFGGLPSIFGATNVATTVAEGIANDTYATKSTALNGITGVDGVVSDAWTPTLVNTDYASWNATTPTIDQVQYAINKGCKGSRADKRLDLFIHNRTRFLTLKRELLGKEHIWVDGKGDDPYGLGSNIEKAYVDGLLQIWDEQMPSGVSYGLNLSQVEFRFLKVPPKHSGDNAKGAGSIGESMFDVEVGFDHVRRGTVVTAVVRGQFLINPRYQVKIADYTT